MSQMSIRHFEKINIQDANIQFISVGRRKCLPLFSGWSVTKPSQYIIHYIMDGIATLRYNNRQVRLQKGDIFVSFPGNVNQFTSDGDEPMEYVWMSVQGSGVDWVMNHSFVYPEKPFATYNVDISPIFLELIQQKEPSCAQWLARYENMFRLLSYMVDHQASEYDQRSIECDNNAYLVNAIDYIHKHCDEPISVSVLAESLFISRDYLYKLFIRNTGMSPSQFIADYKVNRSLWLLADRDLSISKISGMCGFCDSYHYSKTFKKYYHQTPAQYRKEFLR